MNNLIVLFNTMMSRNDDLGLSRYDPSDITSHPCLLPFASGKSRYFLFPLLFVENFFPTMFRHALQIKCRTVPTTLYHLGNAYIKVDRILLRDGISRISTIADEAISISHTNGGCRFWPHPFGSHGAGYGRDSQNLDKESCAHHTARLGQFLLTAGAHCKNTRYSQAGIEAAHAIAELHNWERHDDGTWTVSYYPSSDDQVINTAAEAATLLSRVPIKHCPDDWNDRIMGVCKMIIQEQQQTGGWNYETRSHCARYCVSPNQPDCHHNAMVISSLGNMLDHPSTRSIRQEIINSIEYGLQFHLDQLCPIGSAPLMLSRGRRFACIAGYMESICMLVNIDSLNILNSETWHKRIWKSIDNLMLFWEKNLYNKNNGDVACYRRFGKRYNIKSIRWGSGLAMDAVAGILKHRAENTNNT